jgi:hypothetical protein
MIWLEFEILTARFAANPTYYSNLGAGQEMTRVTLGKSRVREIRPPGSVRAKPNGIATRPQSYKPVIQARNAVRQRRIWLDKAHLLL